MRVESGNGPSSADALPLLQLPDTAFEHVLHFLSYELVAKLRRVSRRFNVAGKRVLNKGFRRAEKYHLKCLKDVKALLPRRESERRNHKLSRHCDILTAIETRISLLSMTFVKYIDLDICCFIPGKVIDEIFSVLHSLQKEEQPPRAYEILQELRDISSMAMEYFDEKIVPTLPCPVSPLKASFLPAVSISGGSGYALSVRYPDFDASAIRCSSLRSIETTGLDMDSTPTGRGFPHRLGGQTDPGARRVSLMADLDRVSKSNKKLAKKTNRAVSNLKKQADTAKSAVEMQNKKMAELEKRFDQQKEVIDAQNARLAEQEEKLAEMNRRLIENEQIMADLTQSTHEKARPSLPPGGTTGRKRAAASTSSEGEGGQPQSKRQKGGNQQDTK